MWASNRHTNWNAQAISRLLYLCIVCGGINSYAVIQTAREKFVPFLNATVLIDVHCRPEKELFMVIDRYCSMYMFYNQEVKRCKLITLLTTKCWITIFNCLLLCLNWRTDWLIIMTHCLADQLLVWLLEILTNCLVQWTLVIQNTDITESRYNKVIFLVPKFNISLYFIVFATRI